MKQFLVVISLGLSAISLRAQSDLGTLIFNNHVLPTVDAPVFLIGGTAGPGTLGAGVYTADLFLISINGAQQNIVLGPNTTFKTGGETASRYIEPVDMSIPGSKPGDMATLEMRVWKTSAGSFEAAAPLFQAGQSPAFTISLGGVGGLPAILQGLQSFTVGAVPEPSILAFILCGVAILILHKRIQ